ncbi:MAG TPA: molybdopterin-dependent oxidoreductase [Candidatus Acidoferrales bacterium]|nr:molybdopterin-dependent oxidoreductase [Candidatus Acidoferrales bacterium]
MSMNRRQWLKVTAGVGAGLALSELGVNVQQVHAATRDMKLSGSAEFTSACNFCSCGCGMICHVKDGKLVNLEGDPDHVINQGSLCSKGAAMSAVPNSPQRLKKPLYRAPGASEWKEISWDEAYDRIAKKIKETREKNWKATEMDGDKQLTANRTDAIAFLGGAQNTNEECYAITKAARLLGTVNVEHQARL